MHTAFTNIDGAPSSLGQGVLGAEHIHEFSFMDLHALRGSQKIKKGRIRIFVMAINIMEKYN